MVAKVVEQRVERANRCISTESLKRYKALLGATKFQFAQRCSLGKKVAKSGATRSSYAGLYRLPIFSFLFYTIYSLKPVVISIEYFYYPVPRSKFDIDSITRATPLSDET